MKSIILNIIWGIVFFACILDGITLTILGKLGNLGYPAANSTIVMVAVALSFKIFYLWVNRK